MKYILQLLIILAVSFAGEILSAVIPAAIPASIYGLTLMLLLLCTGVIKLENIETTGSWLVEIMPVMFIPGGVGIMSAWVELKHIFVAAAVITVVSLVIITAVSGKVTEWLMNYRSKRND